MQLLEGSELPSWFSYPPAFVRIVELGLTDLEPWLILDGDLLRSRRNGLQKRYPERDLVPFARRQDNDDVACWELVEGTMRVVVLHDYASPGWEDKAEFSDFYSWFRQAVEDLIEFE